MKQVARVAAILVMVGVSASVTATGIAARQDLEWTWFLPGNRILTAPEQEAEVAADLHTLAYLPILSRDGPWAEVSYGGRTGWADTEWESPHDRGSARQGILRHRAEPVRGNDPWRLKAAQEVMGVRSTEVKVGGYRLYTDVEDTELLAFLDSAAIAAEEGYFARYGRLPTGNPVRSAVLFATEEGYREFAETQNSPNPGTNLGHAGSGVLAFYAEGRSRRDLATTLVHEIIHLINDRALARRLPSWLEEGTATDLGCVWVEPYPLPAIDADLGDLVSVGAQCFERRIFQLEAAIRAGQAPHVMTLVGLDRENFYQPGRDWSTYAFSAALIRYLVDGENGRLAPGFREFLRKIASGTPARLLELIERDANELDRGLREWVMAMGDASRQSIMDVYPGMSVAMKDDGGLQIGRPPRAPPQQSTAGSRSAPARPASPPRRAADPPPATPPRSELPASASRTDGRPLEVELAISYRTAGIESREGVVEPVRLGESTTDYLAVASAANVTGAVMVIGHVHTSGMATDVKIGIPFHPQLDALLLEDVRQWRFTPGTIDDEPAVFSFSVFLIIDR